MFVVAIRGKLSLYEDICLYGVYNYSIRGGFVMVRYFFFFLLYNFLAGINLLVIELENSVHKLSVSFPRKLKLSPLWPITRFINY